MTDTTFRYVFGPVPSRRLGRSLGVDVVPHKTCTYDCVYCQVGRTTAHTLERKVYVPRDAVVAEVKRKLEESGDPNYVTFSGSGEPTLYSELGALIADIKALTSAPVAVITNGSLLWMPEVRDALLGADVVVPSLDAGTAATFDRVNRPHPGVSFEQVVEGLVAFRASQHAKRRACRKKENEDVFLGEVFSNQLWLEVFLLGNVENLDAEVTELVRHAERIRPDRIQLNTVARPPADSDAVPVSKAELERYAERFGPSAEVIATFAGPGPDEMASDSRAEIVEWLERRPSTIEDIALGLGIRRDLAGRLLQSLLDESRIRSETRNGQEFYLADKT